MKWPERHLNTRLAYKKPGGAVRIDTSANLNKHLFTPADGQIEFDALMETLMCGPRGEIKIWRDAAESLFRGLGHLGVAFPRSDIET